MSEYTYLSAQQLSKRIPYTPRYISEVLKDRVFIAGIHYIRPFSGRKIIYLWEPIGTLMLPEPAAEGPVGIPMSAGGVCHG
jgi:hypothetical protein